MLVKILTVLIIFIKSHIKRNKTTEKHKRNPPQLPITHDILFFLFVIPVRLLDLFRYWLFPANFNSFKFESYKALQGTIYPSKQQHISNSSPRFLTIYHSPDRGWECVLVSISLHLTTSHKGYSKEYQVTAAVSEVPTPNHPLRINLIPCTLEQPSNRYAGGGFGHFSLLHFFNMNWNWNIFF